MRTPAIDMHGHFGPYVAKDQPLYDKWWTQGIDVIKRRARDVGVHLTVVSALRAITPEGPGTSDAIAGNEEAAKAAADHREILFWAVLDPTQRGCFDNVRELLDHPKCAGIKLHPTCHHYEIKEKGDGIFRLAAEHSALVISHSGCRLAFPENFIPFTNEYPEVRLILAHLGHDGEGSLDRQIRALWQSKTPNVWVDTSSGKSIFGGLLEWAVEELGSDRIVFGSDTPLYSVAAQKARIEFAEISRDDKRSILWNNAASLLGSQAPEDPSDQSTVLLCTVETALEAQLIQEALSEHDIPYTADDSDLLFLHYGQTSKERTEICVFERDLEKARDILNRLQDKSGETPPE